MPNATDRRATKASAKSPTRAATTAETAARMTYETRQVLPPDPTVRIIFHGLLSFFFDRARECRVGIHNTTQGVLFQHRHPHDFEVAAWAVTGAGTGNRKCRPIPLIPSIKNPKLIAGVRIDAFGIRERELDGVYVYQKPPLDRFDGRDERDWRWVVDFESDLLYPEGVRNKPETINPYVAINNGLFYTLKKTTRNFVLRPQGGGADTPVGNVAEIVAANIYLNPGGRVDLSIMPAIGLPLTIPLIAVPGVTYEIDITNNCLHGNKPCEFKPNHQDSKEERNDFYLYYDTFTKPAGRPEYELICTDCTGVNKSVRLKEEKQVLSDLGICYDGHDGPVIRSNNEAPCGPTGHGQSGDPTQP